METGEALSVAPPAPAVPEFQKKEVAIKREERPVEIEKDVFRLSRGRLVIEQDPETHRWIYKTVDAQTGEILAQFPLDSVGKLGFGHKYSLGVMYDARA